MLCQIYPSSCQCQGCNINLKNNLTKFKYIELWLIFFSCIIEIQLFSLNNYITTLTYIHASYKHEYIVNTINLGLS